MHCGPTDSLRQHIWRNRVLAWRDGNDLLGRCSLNVSFGQSPDLTVKKPVLKWHTVLLFCFCTMLHDFHRMQISVLLTQMGSLTSKAVCAYFWPVLWYFCSIVVPAVCLVFWYEYWAKKYPYILLGLLWLWWKSSLIFPAFPFKHPFIGLGTALNLMVLLSI